METNSGQFALALRIEHNFCLPANSAAPGAVQVASQSKRLEQWAQMAQARMASVLPFYVPAPRPAGRNHIHTAHHFGGPAFVKGRFMDRVFRSAPAVIAASQFAVLHVRMGNFRSKGRRPVKIVADAQKNEQAMPHEQKCTTC